MFIFLRKKVEIIVSPFADLYVISIWKKKKKQWAEKRLSRNSQFLGRKLMTLVPSPGGKRSTRGQRDKWNKVKSSTLLALHSQSSSWQRTCSCQILQGSFLFGLYFNEKERLLPSLRRKSLRMTLTTLSSLWHLLAHPWTYHCGQGTMNEARVKWQYLRLQGWKITTENHILTTRHEGGMIFQNIRKIIRREGRIQIAIANVLYYRHVGWQLFQMKWVFKIGYI